MKSVFRNSRLIFNPLLLILYGFLASTLANLSVKQDGASPVQILSIWVASCFALRVLMSDHPSSSETFFELIRHRQPLKQQYQPYSAIFVTQLPDLYINYPIPYHNDKKCQRQSRRLTDRLDGASCCQYLVHAFSLAYLIRRLRVVLYLFRTCIFICSLILQLLLFQALGQALFN